MQKKFFGFLKNMTTNHKGRVGDEDVFQSLDVEGACELLKKLVKNTLPKKFVEEHSRNRHRGFLLELDSDPVRVTLGGLWGDKEVHALLPEIVAKMIDHALKSPWGNEAEPDLFHEKVMELQRTLKLSDEEVDIFLVGICIAENLLWDPRTNSHGGAFGRNAYIMSKALNISEVALMQTVSPDGLLRRFQCLDDDLDPNGRLLGFLNGLRSEPLSSIYFKKDETQTLPWNDFEDLTKAHGTILKRLLTSGDKPVNILLYGAPGTGKTSFAKALAREVKRDCYSIAQNMNDRDGQSVSSPDFRFCALQVCDGQINQKGSLIIVDEADDMLRSHSGFGGLFEMFGEDPIPQTGDKGLLNTVLDTMHTSTIWITNTPANALDESSRRRFDYSICFEPLNCEQRKRIWKNNLTRLKMGRLINDRQIEEFAAQYPVSAGGISQTMANLEKMHPKKAEVPQLVEQLMKPHCELLGVKLANDKLLPSKDYSLNGLNIQGDVQLERIVESVRGFMQQKGKNVDPDRPRMNLLLSGAPGTGKTEFVKYLGDILKTKVNVCMGSDLLSMWVGGTEQNIAQAFHRAEAEHAILFLDEIDGLVQSRTNAHNSWEVTQVNELLHQMENFNGVMIGATNFIQNLDQAIMRRFTFKLQFNYLDAAGKRAFFERMFKSTLTEDEQSRLEAIPNLAPGDFRTVRQSLFYYGGEVTNAKRLQALEQESEAKHCGAFVQKERIGF